MKQILKKDLILENEKLKNRVIILENAFNKLSEIVKEFERKK